MCILDIENIIKSLNTKKHLHFSHSSDKLLEYKHGNY